MNYVKKEPLTKALLVAERLAALRRIILECSYWDKDDKDLDIRLGNMDSLDVTNYMIKNVEPEYQEIMWKIVDRIFNFRKELIAEIESDIESQYTLC